MSEVKFIAIPDNKGIRDGENGYTVLVNGKQVIDWIGCNHLDVANGRLVDLWRELGVKLEFDYE